MTVTVERARSFARTVVSPRIADWEQAALYPRDAVRASGLTGLRSPTADGGLDLGYPEAALVFEELGRGDAALAFSLSVHNTVASTLARSGDETLRARWTTLLVSGEALGGFALTEPHAGSDAAAITTLATRANGRWSLRGRKAWVTLGAEADVFLVVAKTERQPGHRDVAIFVLDGAAPGVEFGEPYAKATAAFLPIADMTLADAPATLLVPPGQGMRAAFAAIEVGRFNVAAIANGIQAEALQVALDYASRRIVFGTPVLDHQGMAWALADVATDLEASRGLTRRAAEQLAFDEGRVAVAHAKRFATDAALRAAITCTHTLGAYGLLHDCPLARFIALAEMLQVVDGTTEVQRMVIARDLHNRVNGLTGASDTHPADSNTHRTSGNGDSMKAMKDE